MNPRTATPPTAPIARATADRRSRTLRPFAGAALIGAALALGLLASSLWTGAAFAAEDPPTDISGIYEMDGKTTVVGSPIQFRVAGKLVIRQKGSTCDIKVDGTYRRVEGDEGPASVALIGTGEARLEGKRFSGTAEVQTLVSEVPGVDVSAAYMPKKFGPRIDAVAMGEVIEDGVIEFEIRSTLVGEGFTLPEGRRTIVRATRIARKATELKRNPSKPAR